MTWKDIFLVEKELLDECRAAIESGREFSEKESMFYEAYEAAQKLRRYLMEKD